MFAAVNGGIRKGEGGRKPFGRHSAMREGEQTHKRDSNIESRGAQKHTARESDMNMGVGGTVTGRETISRRTQADEQARKRTGTGITTKKVPVPKQ